MLSFLFVVAVCAAFAAHERLHELELPDADHSSHFEHVDHDHPGVITAPHHVGNVLVAIATLDPAQHSAMHAAHPARALRLRPGPPVDDDVGLHDVLSVYLI